MATESLEKRMENIEDTIKNYDTELKNLQETNNSLRHEIERLQAVNEIQNLMSRYEFLHTSNRHKEVMEMYAKKAPSRVYNF